MQVSLGWVMGSQPQVCTCDLAFSRWLLTGLYQCTSYCELQWEETNIPGWKWELGINRKSQGFLMHRTLALISAAWICSRETEAEGQPSPSCAVGKQRLSGQHTVELLDLLSRITSSKKIKVDKQETNWNEIWMSLPSIHPLEHNCLGLAMPIP